MITTSAIDLNTEIPDPKSDEGLAFRGQWFEQDRAFVPTFHIPDSNVRPLLREALRSLQAIRAAVLAQMSDKSLWSRAEKDPVVYRRELQSLHKIIGLHTGIARPPKTARVPRHAETASKAPAALKAPAEPPDMFLGLRRGLLTAVTMRGTNQTRGFPEPDAEDALEDHVRPLFFGVEPRSTLTSRSAGPGFPHSNA